MSARQYRTHSAPAGSGRVFIRWFYSHCLSFQPPGVRLKNITLHSRYALCRGVPLFVSGRDNCMSGRDLMNRRLFVAKTAHALLCRAIFGSQNRFVPGLCASFPSLFSVPFSALNTRLLEPITVFFNGAAGMFTTLPGTCKAFSPQMNVTKFITGDNCGKTRKRRRFFTGVHITGRYVTGVHGIGNHNTALHGG